MSFENFPCLEITIFPNMEKVFMQVDFNQCGRKKEIFKNDSRGIRLFSYLTPVPLIH